MWLFCKSGFFSAVQNCKDIDSIHIRARFKGDLERLFAAHGVRAEIVFTPHCDYSYRADIQRGTWANIVSSEAIGIDYNNFKNAVHDGTMRDEAYMDVWCAMRSAQQIENRKGADNE